ncbi:hypothetical protein BZG36_03418 [Bifiguratus adelaidae]|uniref:Uncharacterized protein n=1 Tax=Bifiguratus adelaidae TaxID=1938954 RepID=A0A261XYV7_9FUNG|nr:hypothetical protein BZG36_03418 [Bifiguratus adelaidae]
MSVPEDSEEPAVTCTPLLLRILSAVQNDEVDPKHSTTTDLDEDTPFERSLCALWDICSVERYAQEAMKDGYYRVLLKAILVTKRDRVMELAFGTLANLACHQSCWRTLLEDADLMKLVATTLRDSDSALVLLESSRVLTNLLNYATSLDNEVMEYPNLSDILVHYQLFQQCAFIAVNTLNPQLLLQECSLLNLMLIYLYANSLINSQTVTKEDIITLMAWGCSKLEAEAAGIGIANNYDVAKALLTFLLSAARSEILDQSEEASLSRSLNDPISRILGSNDSQLDDEIRGLASALQAKLESTLANGEGVKDTQQHFMSGSGSSSIPIPGHRRRSSSLSAWPANNVSPSYNTLPPPSSLTSLSPTAGTTLERRVSGSLGKAYQAAHLPGSLGQVQSQDALTAFHASNTEPGSNSTAGVQPQKGIAPTDLCVDSSNPISISQHHLSRAEAVRSEAQAPPQKRAASPMGDAILTGQFLD